MLILARTSIIIIILSIPSAYADTVDAYIDACIKNQKNNMGPELCECMASKAEKLSPEEFDFLYGITAKDQEKVNSGHANLEPMQKVNVMQLSMAGPSQCTSELATKNDAESQAAPEPATTSESASD